MMRKWLIFLFFPSLVLAKPLHNEVWSTPWFTGPLLAPGASCNALREVTWQPYLFVTNNYGSFDNHWNRVNGEDMWVIQPLLDFTYGIATFMDLETVPAFSYQISGGASSVRMNDTPLYLGIQALRQSEGSWVPDLRIRLQQVFPFGQYDKMNPKKKGTDGTGKGSYQSGITFDFQKTFKTSPEHYFRLRWSFEAILFTSMVHIQGLSTYGGGPKTEGKVRPGKTYNVFLSGEYTITRNWAFAFDTLYTLITSNKFSGKKGGASVGNPTSQQLSFAPAIEYNYSANLGLIGGAWFTLAGKNAGQFCSGAISGVFTY
ncbi:MAG: hypothetical protein KDK76_04185 [Chlamydiia bacterium]|nr:hypothetical protein [Chlamydiia bacterium]